MDLSGTINRLLHEIHMLQHPYVDGGHFSRVMATKNMVHLIQRRQVIVPCVVSLADSQPFVGMHVEERQLPIGEFVRTRNRGTQEPAAEQQQPDNGRFQERSTSPGPGILV